MKSAVFGVVLGLLSAVPVLAQQQPVHPGNGVSTPVLVKEVKPTYPEAAKRANIEGTVLLEAVVQEDGTIGDIHVVRSLDTQYDLDGEALKAAKQWTFKPGTKAGQPVPVIVTIEISFTTKRQSK